MKMDHITSEHVRRNVRAREGWELYAEHRHRVTQLLISARRTENDRLCVLGAGNSNDLDLEALGSSFAEVHLVDLDTDALEFGMSRQQPSHSERFRLHGNTDVTGVAPVIGNWSPENPPTDRELQDFLVQSPQAAVPNLPAGFDVVISIGLFTQLIDSIVLAVGPNHPSFVNLVQSIRLRHLRLLVELLSPGGSAFLVTELVSSDTFPQLSEVRDNELGPTVSGLINQHNFFTGTNPVVLRSLFETDAIMAPLVSNVEVLPPWKWQFIGRVYAVCAFHIRRSMQ